MTSKNKGIKRKNNISNKKTANLNKTEDENNEVEVQSDDNEDNLLTSIDDENDDSSDSEEEIENAEDSDDAEDENEDSEDDEDENEISEDDEDENDAESSEEDEESAEEEEESKSNIENTTNKDEKVESGLKAIKVDEYEHDTSDEEDIRNTVGNIPKNWYDDYPHLGYTQTGEKLFKPPTGDQLDEFLRKVEDPDFWRTVRDPQTGQEVILGEEELELIRRIREQKIPDADFDEYALWVDWFTAEVMQTPLRKFPEHKRSFLPSKIEARKVSKMVHALKMGWIKTRKEAAKERRKKDPEFYMLWQTDDSAEDMRRIHKHIPAPKRHLPGHAESYNPPPEYLFDDREMKEWEKQKNAPWKRKLHFVPQKYKSLREVPSYSRYIKERFLRCLDLYLCPRAIKMRLNIEPEDLVPQLPSPKDLQPFPTTLAMEYRGHNDMVRCMSCDTLGQYLITGSDDETVKIWEVMTGRCLVTIPMGDVVRAVSWCPNTALSLVAVAAGNNLFLINPGVGDRLVISKTDLLLEESPEQDIILTERVRSTVQWKNFSSTDVEFLQKRIRIQVSHFKPVTQVVWHGKGDYFATVMPDGQSKSVVVNQLSRRRSQLPFSRSKGLVQCVAWHPVRPFLFVATQRNIRIYDLVQQTIVKKLLSNSKWISSMSVHPAGDNLLVGTYDRKVLWFDLDLSVQPYQQLRLHGAAVRSVAYHRRYPLFASGGDDRSLIVCHGMVYNDLLQNPLIVPLKKLQDHEHFNDFGIFDVMFHPSQPWVFSAGADATVKLYS